jgi:hypothetical protein
MEHNNQVGSYLTAHKSLMSMLADSVMAKLAEPSPAAPAAAEPEQAPDTPFVDSFFFRSRAKRCGCAQCKAVRAAM